MGSGNVKNKRLEEQKILLEVLEKKEDSLGSLENEDKIKAVMFNDNEELSKHEDLLIQACFCDLPTSNPNIFLFERKVMENKFNIKDLS
jgi:hypothetical protein